ncbi:MAG: tetratricopeptide repeat protein [Acidimicrobiales bacterium]
MFVLDDFERNVEGQADGQPRFDAQGRALVVPAALKVLDALLWAIRQTASPARVIVTCRYRVAGPPGPQRLVEEALEALAGAELTKKTAHLDAFSATGAAAVHRADALRLADGNPRLLEALDRALLSEDLDAEAVLASLDAVTAEFREAVLVEALLAAQSPETARALACLAVCRLPVDEAAVGAIAAADVGSALAHADAAGLVESGVEASTGFTRYRVPALVAGLLGGVLGPEAQTHATEQAAEHLWSVWWEAGAGIDEPRALELLRLTLDVGHLDHAAIIGRAVASSWVSQARYLEAVILAEQVLAHVEAYGIRHNLARAQEVLGDTESAVANYEAALAACPADDHAEQAPILHNMAGIRAAQGEPDAAMDLYRQSLDIEERIGDARGKAATLHAMADIRAVQGEPEAAMDLYRQSLDIEERIGDARGKAATLANIGFIQAGAGETEAAVTSLRQSAAIVAGIGAWPDVATVVANIGALAGEDAVAYFAQAAWLSTAVRVEISGGLRVVDALVQALGPEHETSLLLSLHGLALVQQAERHRDHAGSLSGSCSNSGSSSPACALGSKHSWTKSTGSSSGRDSRPRPTEAVARNAERRPAHRPSI